jgi:hypothetical protein
MLVWFWNGSDFHGELIRRNFSCTCFCVTIDNRTETINLLEISSVLLAVGLDFGEVSYAMAIKEV